MRRDGGSVGPRPSRSGLREPAPIELSTPTHRFLQRQRAALLFASLCEGGEQPLPLGFGLGNLDRPRGSGFACWWLAARGKVDHRGAAAAADVSSGPIARQSSCADLGAVLALISPAQR